MDFVSTSVDDYLPLVGGNFEGNHGLVQLGMRISTGERVVIKMLDFAASPGHRTVYQLESRIMQSLSHKHIVPLLDHHEEGSRLFLIMQYAQKGDLLQHISQAPNGMLDVANARRLFVQLIFAIEYMHSIGLAHRYVRR
jgi:serine/threonine protein kinase